MEYYSAIKKNEIMPFFNNMDGLRDCHTERSKSYREEKLSYDTSYVRNWKRNDTNRPQFSRSVVSDSLQPHELQHARPPCPSKTPGVYSNSCTSSRWCHPAIVVPFSSCPRSLQASGSFPVSQLFAWGGRSIGVSASASVLPTNRLRDS